MGRNRVLAVGIALVICAFALGWLVAGRSGDGIGPVTSSPYGSTQADKAPAPERFFIPPMGKRPAPQSVLPKVLPKNLREYTQCAGTHGKAPGAYRVVPRGSTVRPCVGLPLVKAE